MTRVELQLLVNSIADEILGPPTGAVSNETSLPAAPIPARASRRLPDQVLNLTPAQFAAMIDHTNLKPEAQPEDIVQLCDEAREHGFAAVCTHSIWVSLVHQNLRGSAIKVCTVTGFPTGAVPSAVKQLEAEIAIRNGATEIDMVLPVGLLRRGELDRVRHDIEAVSEVTRRHGAILKVILESAALEEKQIAIACALAKLGGAQFVKTSTGFHLAGGATQEHVALMRRAVGNDLGVKASGGIRTLDDAFEMLAAGANRLGTSSGVALVGAMKKLSGG